MHFALFCLELMMHVKIYGVFKLVHVFSLNNVNMKKKIIYTNLIFLGLSACSTVPTRKRFHVVTSALVRYYFCTINKNWSKIYFLYFQFGEPQARESRLSRRAVVTALSRCLLKSSDSFEIFKDYVSDKLRTMSSKVTDLQYWAKREIQRDLINEW